MSGLDVVLALEWKPLWDLGGGVLPLAFHSFEGGMEEAAATLMLNHVTRSIFGLDATYLTDAMTALAITDRDIPRQLKPALQWVFDLLRTPGRTALNAAYSKLVETIGTVSPRFLRPAHHAHTSRLAQLQQRLSHPGRPLPGLTTHQAKGGEWNHVGIRLFGSQHQVLARGQSIDGDIDRKLYVACTRARRRTVEVT